MYWKLFILPLLFVTIFYGKTENIYRNKTLSIQTTSRDHISFVLVNPKRIHYTEVIIKRFLTRLIGPIVEPLTLKSLSFREKNLESTINAITKIIRAKIMEFAQASGLTASVRQYKQTLWNSVISKNWFTENLIQGSLLLSDLITIGEEIQFAIDHYFKTYNVTLYKNKDVSSSKITKNLKFFDTLNNAASFSKNIFQCVLFVSDKKNPISSFNLVHVLASLTKGLPNNTVKLFKSNLNQAFTRSLPSNITTNEQLCSLLCHSLVKKTSHYNDCVKELHRFVTCVSSSRNRDSDKAITSHKNFVKPWLNVVEYLNGCKIDIDQDASVHCKFYQKLPKSTTQQVKYIYERILDQRISRQSFLNRIANKLGNVLSRSKWGRQITYDICQYFAIYQEGHRKLNTFSKTAATNKRTAIRYKKLLVSLNMYKNGILKKIMLTIGNLHRSILEIQKFLVYGIKSYFKESWQSHFKILVCLSKWIKKLLELFGCTNLDDTDTNISISTDISLVNITDSYNEFDENNNMKYLITYSNKNQIQKKANMIFEKLMLLMYHVSKMQSRYEKSTLACLANNLLLITMLMETISFVSTLFCLGEHKDESNIEEVAEDWESLEHERRSLILKNFSSY